MIKKITFWAVGSFLFSLLIFVGFLPTLISTPVGTKTIVKLINAHIKGKLEVEKVSLNWLGTQRLNHLKLEDNKGKVIFSSLSLETDTSLLYLAFGGRSLNRTVLKQPYLYLSTNTKGDEKKKGKYSKKKKFHSLPTFKNSLLVEHGIVVLESENNSPTTLSDILVNKTTTPGHLKIQATTSQGSQQGLVTVDATLDDKIQAEIHVKDFPTTILDHLADSKLYTDALGPLLNSDLNVEKQSSNTLNIAGSAKTAHLTAYIEGVSENGFFAVNPQSHLDFTLTPALFKQIIDEKQRGKWELASKTDLSIQIEKGVFPLKFDWSQIVLQASAKIERVELHHAALGSYSLKHFDISMTTLNNLGITFQGEIQGKESTKLVGNVSMTPSGGLVFDYTCNGFPVTLLELASTDLEKNIRLLFGNKFDLVGKGTYISKQFDTQVDVHSPTTQLTGHLIGYLPELNFELSGKHEVQGEKAKVMGKTLNFTLSGIGKFQDRQFSIPFLQGNVFNPYFECDLRGQIGEEGKPFSWDQIQLTTAGIIKKLPLEENLPQSTLQNATLYMQVDGSKNLITGKLDSQSVTASFEIDHFIQNDEISLDLANTNFKCNLQDFPLGLIGSFIAEDLDLTQFLGKTLTLTSKGTYSSHHEPRLLLDLNAQGNGFSTSLSLGIDGALSVKQNRPSYIYWEVTPERCKALMRLFRLNPEYEPTFTLIRPTQLELNITQFTCPTAPAKNLGNFLCQSGFVGELHMGNTIFRNKNTHESITFQEITGLIKGENFSKAIDLSFSGNISADNIPQNQKSTFSFAGQMFNFWTQSGKFNREGLTIKGESNLHLLPVRQLVGIVPLDHETRSIVEAVLGEFVNAHVSGEISQLSGPITIDVQSSNFKALLPLQLKQNILYLRDYVDAEISLTEAVNETLLKDINPLLLTGAYADHPLKLYIDPQGFGLPIKHYALEKVEIGKAIVDIGKIRVRNGGQIQRLMQFVNAKEISPDGLMEAWFTPIFLSLHHGQASYKRFDALLAGNVQIAMWGGVNLITDQVNMTLAIAPTTLYERFKITGLTKKDMFQVKMGGTTSKLDLDWSTAYSRIAWIIARSAAGQLSNILGGILEQLISSPEAATPPTTTDPLPWESLYPSEPGRGIPQETAYQGDYRDARSWTERPLS